jgi:hypothetical protein
MSKKKTKQVQYRLWTPVANAYDIYRRRLIANPEAFYEHTWRLIHIQESLIVTLGSSLSTRLLHLWQSEPDAIIELNKLRERITGIKLSGINASESSSRNGGGCLSGGSMVKWIELLNSFKKPNFPTQCPFVASVADYLEQTLDVPLAFLTTWERIAPVPATYKEPNLPLIGRFFAINSLRNKIAHVPISSDTFERLHKELRQEVLSLLTNSSDWKNRNATADPGITQWHSPLRGKLLNNRVYVTGSNDLGEIQDIKDDKIYWEWSQADNENVERWVASPFVHISNDVKVSLLIELDNLSADLEEECKGDYYRFAAEVEPVREVIVNQEVIQCWIPVEQVSSLAEPPTDAKTDEAVIPLTEIKEEPEVDLAKLTPLDLRTKAENARQNRNYPEAVRLFDELEKRNDRQYTDVAILHHGSTLWRYANRFLSGEEQVTQMQRAIKLLEKASQHQDIIYRAEARYDRSKALYHLSEILQDDSCLLNKAIKDAESAANSGYKPSYISWLDRLKNKKD